MTFRCSLVVICAALCASGLQAEEARRAENTSKLAYGQLIKHGDKLVFSPCRDRSYAMMEDVSPDRSVTGALKSVGLDAGKKLYVELMAVVDGGMIRASGLNQARTEGRCQQPGGSEESWRAAGNEPGWLLAVGKEVIVVKRQGKADVSVTAVPPRNEGGATHFDTATGGNRLAVNFEKVLCHDTMADSVFGWTATVNLNGQTLKGCAWQR